MQEISVTIILWIVLFAVVYILLLSFKRLFTRFHFRYKSKGPFLLSQGEMAFFNVLIQSLSSDFYVCPKVRVADVIEVDLPRTDKQFWSLFNKISKKHVDFLICSRLDFSPRLVIELDGGSHNSSIRAERDRFVDEAFAQANIPILHIAAQSFYDKVQLSAQIQNTLKPTLTVE